MDKKSFIEHLNRDKDACSCLMSSFLPDSIEKLVGKDNASLKDQHGGVDQGSDYWAVWEFKLNDGLLYIKFQGWHVSHYGDEYDRFHIVEPKLTTVTVWTTESDSTNYDDSYSSYGSY